MPAAALIERAATRRTKLRELLTRHHTGLTVSDLMGLLPADMRVSDRTLRDDLSEMRGVFVADWIDNSTRNARCALWKVRK